MEEAGGRPRLGSEEPELSCSGLWNGKPWKNCMQGMIG